MTDKKKKVKLLPILFILIAIICAVGGTTTFAKFYGDYEKKNETAKIADAVMKIEVNSVYRTDSQGSKVSAIFNKNATTVTLYDIEPEDEIEYYFTVTGVDGKRVNEVSMNVVLTVAVRLETIAVGADGKGIKNVDYFAGWKQYAPADGVKDGGHLRVYHGSETDTEQDILPSRTGISEVDYKGNSLLVTESADGITNKTGFVMKADDDKKEYSYHLRFTVPRQNSEKEHYAGARVYFEIQAVAEQARDV